MTADQTLVYYVGPVGPVDVPQARAADVSFGDAVSVADPALRAALLIQDGNWSSVDPNKPAEAAPAKAKTAPAEETK